MAISMLKIRRPLGRLIFNMGITIPGKTVFLIETAPCPSWHQWFNSVTHIIAWFFFLPNELLWSRRWWVLLQFGFFYVKEHSILECHNSLEKICLTGFQENTSLLGVSVWLHYKAYHILFSPENIMGHLATFPFEFHNAIHLDNMF